MEYLVMNGMQSPHTLLNEYLKQHLGCLPGDIGLPFALKEPSLDIQVELTGFEWNKLDQGRVVFDCPFHPSHQAQIHLPFNK
jgi:hypothetical protein